MFARSISLLLAVTAIAACSDGSSTAPSSRMAQLSTVSASSGGAASASIQTAAPWCGAVANFATGALPAGWSSSNSGATGTGLLYDRVNAQSGGWTTITIPGAVTAPLAEIRLQYDGYLDPILVPGASAMARIVTFATAAGYYQALEGMERYASGQVFYRSELVTLPFPQSGGSTVYKVKSKPTAYGIYRHLIRVADGGFFVQSTNLVTGTVVSSTIMPLTGFKLADIQSLQFAVSSPDNPTWADNLSINCL